MVPLPDRQLPHTASPQGKACSIRVAKTCDIDEQAALLRGWSQTYDQMSAGSFSGTLLEADIGRVRLFREFTSNSLHQVGFLPAGTIAVGVPLALHGNATFCFQPCDGMQLHVFSGNDAFEFLSPSGLDIAGFVLTERDLCKALILDEAETVLRSLAMPHLRQGNSRESDRMRSIFRDVCEVMTQCPEFIRNPVRFSSMSRDVIAALAAALVQAGDDRSDIPAAKRARVVRDARDLVMHSPDGYLSVAELCRTLGVSRRALQYSFQEALGVGPSAYLRAVRMNGARRAIKNARSVADAATLWGFWHFGRFARDYKAMFGELPSETFRRCHGPSR